MKKSFTKSLMLHIRYPWTAACLLILWIGVAVLCAIMHFSHSEVIALISLTSVATLIVALIGFKG